VDVPAMTVLHTVDLPRDGRMRLQALLFLYVDIQSGNMSKSRTKARGINIPL
jgi:hypothetical protein